MTDMQRVMEFVKDHAPVDAKWIVHRNEGSYDRHDVDERWTREVDASAMGFHYKETVRLVRYGNMEPNMVNVQYSVFARETEKDNWKFLTGHSDGVMTLNEARDRFIK